MTRLSFLVTLTILVSAQAAFPQEGFPSVTLPPELDRVLRDYERGWQDGNPEALSSLFTADGFAMPSGRLAVRGRRAIAEEYRRAGGALVLRAIAYDVSGPIGYIIGAYGYGDAPRDSGKFVLVLQRAENGRWLIAADIDNGNGN